MKDGLITAVADGLITDTHDANDFDRPSEMVRSEGKSLTGQISINEDSEGGGAINREILMTAIRIGC